MQCIHQMKLQTQMIRVHDGTLKHVFVLLIVSLVCAYHNGCNERTRQSSKNA